MIERKIWAIPAKDAQDPTVLYDRVKGILEHESEGLKYVPSDLPPGLEAVKERFKRSLDIRNDPAESRSFSPIKAAALFVDRSYRLPLLRLGKTAFKNSVDIFEDLAGGIEHATSAILRVEDAAIYGIDDATRRELALTAEDGLTKEQLGFYIESNFDYSQNVTQIQFNDFLVDPTGSYLLDREEDRLKLMMEGTSPYTGRHITPRLRPTEGNLEGFRFARKAFEAIYPLAQEKFNGVVV